MAKVLIVDDEAIITMQLEERLQAMGHTIAGMAASGADAIEKAKLSVPDIVLMDIVMPGKLSGIDAAQVIVNELDIPVIFVTAYADSAIIEKARRVRPYGYIVKPFNELELRAAIEVALFRKVTERETKISENPQISDSTPPTELPVPDAEYLAMPGIKTVLLEDIFSDLVLFLYVDPTVRESVFKHAIETGIQKGGRFFFAYQESILQKFFIDEIARKLLYTKRIKKDGVYEVVQVLEKCSVTLVDGKTLQLVLDFSDITEFDDIVAVKDLILKKREAGLPITGMIAVSMANIDHNRIRQISEGIGKIIVSTGKDTALSFTHTSFHSDTISVVPQSTIEDVVKKLLEPVILSHLDRPISGFDLVHEIHNRYHVLVPQARVYTFLYELQSLGYLEMKMSGKSKLYYPTDAGKKYIRQRLNEFKSVFQLITGTESNLS